MTKHLNGNCQHCGGVLEFPAEQAGEAATCPHCRQETLLLLAPPPEETSPLRKRAIIFISLALLILVGGVVGAQLAINRAKRITGKNSKPAAAPAQVKPDAAPQAGFQVSSVVLEKAAGSALVFAVGTVTETANRKRFGVQVEIGLFDRNHQPCGTAKDYQASLDAGGQWRFRALVVEKAAVSAKLLSVREGQ